MSEYDKPAYELHPGEGVGPVRLGMMPEAVARALGLTSGAFGDGNRWSFLPDGSFHVDFGTHGAEEIEIAGSTFEDQMFGRIDPPIVLSYKGVDVFRTPVDELAEALGPPFDIKEGGSEYDFPALGISIWRGDGPTDEGWFPQYPVSIVISRRR